LQVKPHVVPSHVALPLVGTAHGVQSAPQLETLLLETHAPPQSWNPALHVYPHEVPSHVAVAFAGMEHAEHEAPQLLTLLLLTHAAPHAW
jgi:hypothetical protein